MNSKYEPIILFAVLFLLPVCIAIYAIVKRKRKPKKVSLNLEDILEETNTENKNHINHDRF